MFITSAKEVMFLPGFVSLLVCLSVGFQNNSKKLWTDFDENFRDCTDWNKEEIIRFWK